MKIIHFEFVDEPHGETEFERVATQKQFATSASVDEVREPARELEGGERSDHEHKQRDRAS